MPITPMFIGKKPKHLSLSVCCFCVDVGMNFFSLSLSHFYCSVKDCAYVSTDASTATCRGVIRSNLAAVTLYDAGECVVM